MTGFKAVGFKKDDDSIVLPDRLNQYYTLVYDEYKLIHLIAILFILRSKKVIIFASTCETVNYLSQLLQELQITQDVSFFENQKILKLHGKMKHDERKVIFSEFLSTNCIFIRN